MEYKFEALNGFEVEIKSWHAGIDVRLVCDLYLVIRGRERVLSLRSALEQGGTIYENDGDQVLVKHRDGVVAIGTRNAPDSVLTNPSAVFKVGHLPDMLKVIDDALSHSDEEHARIDAERARCYAKWKAERPAAKREC